MSGFSAMLEAKRKMVPKAGFNVVGVDTYSDDPVDALFLVGNFGTREEAQKVLDSRQKEYPENKYYIYDTETG